MAETAITIISVALIGFVAGLILGFELDKRDKGV